MNKNIKIKTLFLISFILIFTITFYLINNDKNERIDILKQNEIKNLKLLYNFITKNFRLAADSRYDKIKKDKKVITIFSKAKFLPLKEQDILKQELYHYLLPLFTRMKKVGLTNLHFVFQNNKTFLREHKVEKSGDDLTNYRYTIKYVNKTQKHINGFEQGRTKHAFRYVYPLFDKNNNYIGAIDFSFSSEYLQKILSDSLNIHSHFLVDKIIFNKKAWKDDKVSYKYTTSIENNDYLFTAMSHKSLNEVKKAHPIINEEFKIRISENMKSENQFSFYKSIKDNAKMITFLPIKNVEHKKTVAYLISYTNREDILYINNRFKLIIFIMFFILLINFIFLYINFNQKGWLKKEVERQLKYIKKLNRTLENRVIQEIEKSRQKDKQLLQQSRLAQMGEMISMIAHQWRQPLTAISSTSTALNLNAKFDKLDKDSTIELTNNISEYTFHLSSTIDDFRDFFKPNKEKQETSYEELIKSVLSIIEISISINNIELKQNINCKEKFTTYPNEIKQVILNIMQNSQEILKENINNIDKPYIKIDTYKQQDDLILEISDNGGGIQNNIIDKIFDPYFSTKTKKDGTGLGLYMSKIIIEDHCNGSLTAINNNHGAVFKIVLNNNRI